MKKKNKIIKTQNQATIWFYFTGIIGFLLLGILSVL